jgi:synaptic vesicle membrane protein VAT-1
MRALFMTRRGGPEVLLVRETPSPIPGPGEILVRVCATGVGFAEVLARQGGYPLAPAPPCVMGYDAAGTVEAHGPDVSSPPIGARVMVICHFGGHAEFVAVPAQHALPVPDDFSFEEAACIPWNYLVAHYLVFRVASVRPGERVLVHAAGSGVGTAAVQLLNTIPDIVLFATASAFKHEALHAMGCRHTINYRAVDYAKEVRRLTDGEGVDVVLDSLGGGDWRKGYDLLRPGGRMVAFGIANIMTGERRNPIPIIRELLRMPWFSPLQMIEANRSVAGVSTGRLWANPQVLVESLNGALELCRLRGIRPHVDSVHNFEQAAAAHRRIVERKNIGRVILVP